MIHPYHANMKLVPGAPAPEFRSSIALTYDTVAADRDEAGEADWRWPIAERFLQRMNTSSKTTLLEIGAGVGYTSVASVVRYPAGRRPYGFEPAGPTRSPSPVWPGRV